MWVLGMPFRGGEMGIFLRFLWGRKIKIGLSFSKSTQILFSSISELQVRARLFGQGLEGMRLTTSRSSGTLERSGKRFCSS